MNVIADFEKHFDKKERTQILCTIMLMNFANRLMNSFRSPPIDNEKALDGLRDEN